MSKHVYCFEKIERALMNPPPSADELLGHLKDMDCYLSGRESRLGVSKREAVRWAATGDILLKLTKHADDRVQVAAVACLVSLIEKVSPFYQPPHFVDCPAPFERIRDMFESIVDALAHLGDIWSPLFAKRLFILEIVADCKPCLVMMLEFPELIEKMFESFFNSVRNDHPKAVVSGMHTIMSFLMEVIDNPVVKNKRLAPLIFAAYCIGFLPENTAKQEIPAAINLASGVFDSCASEEMMEMRKEYMAEMLLNQSRGLLAPLSKKKKKKKKAVGDGMGNVEGTTSLL